MSSALSRLLVVSENYPQLKATEAFQRSAEVFTYRQAGASGPARGEVIYYYKCWPCHNEYTRTAGSPLTWLHDFLQEPGGRAFDDVGIHLYPIDLAARRGYGPEWSMQVLAQARRVLTAAGVSAPIWDTEVNVGRYLFRKSSSRAFTGTSGAAMVARTYLLQLSGGVSRVYWYAADDIGWGGTWLEQPDLRHLSPAGSAYAVLRGLLVGARATGCHSSRGRYSCSFRLTHGRTLTAVWTTGAAYRTRPPAGSHVTRTVTGATRSVSSRTRVVVGSAPVYFLNHR